ncbi:sugar phosphate nucleotidyltransferase [Candidatus Cloacimonadaceae bacterium]
MVRHTLQFCKQSGIDNLILSVNPSDQETFAEEAGDFAIGCESFQIIPQPINKGTACAIELCDHLVRTAYTATLFGDNLFEYSMVNSVADFITCDYAARIHTTQVMNPQDYASVEFGNGKIVSIIDKPQKPISSVIMTGFMIFQTKELFRRIKLVKIDRFGEYNMMGMFPELVSDGAIDHHRINGWWIDAGTSIEHLYRATTLVHDIGINKKLID